MKKNRWVGALLTLCLLLGTLLTGCGRDKEYQYNFDNGCIKAQYDESYWEYMDAGKSGDYYELLFYEKGRTRRTPTKRATSSLSATATAALSTRRTMSTKPRRTRGTTAIPSAGRATAAAA